MDYALVFRNRQSQLDEAHAIFKKALDEKRTMTQAEERAFDRHHEKAEDLAMILRDPRTAGREDRVFGRDEACGGERRTFNAEDQRLAFAAWCAGGFAALAPSVQARYQKQWDELQGEQRALSADTGPSTIATGTTGATTVAQGFPYRIDAATKYFGGIIDAADYLDTETGAPLPYPTIDDTANNGELTAENGIVSGSDLAGAGAEALPTFGVAPFSAYMYDSGFVRVPVQLLADSAFDTAQLIQKELTTRILRKVNTACTTGTGTAQPHGVVTAATSGAAAAAAATIAYNDLTALKFSVDRSYREQPGAAWMFNDNTLQKLSELKDTTGRPLLSAGGASEGVQNDTPQTLLGHRFYINNAMANIGASSKSILFGDFKRYKIRRVLAMQVTRTNELFMQNLQVGFIAWQRFDGRLVNSAAIKYLQHPAS